MARVLVVDDDPDFVAVTRRVLEREGHTVVSAANSTQALACIGEDAPDLIILDVIMSTVLDGLSVSRELEKSPDYRDIPIIMVTSITGTPDAQLFPTDDYLHLDTFLSKPVSAQRLVREVRRLLKQ